MRTLSILGSTGSIGTQTLELVRRDKDMRIAALAAYGGKLELLLAQIQEFAPSLVCVYDEKKAEKLAAQLGTNVTRNGAVRKAQPASAKLPQIVTGMDGLIACANYAPAETVVVAVVGMIGIQPTIAAIRAHKKIALANKETLVCAGHIIMPLAAKEGVALMPVDSEHSAIYQCLVGEPHEGIDKLLLTASGGPFRGKTLEELVDVKPQDALKHPNWSMGAKITIDSSTMVNKALEVMEAHWLFDVPVDAIQIVVQPQSIIHSMVQFKDGAVKAQLGVPSMLLPIAYALYAPERREIPDEKLDFAALSSIALSVPDLNVFRGLWLGIEAGKAGGIMPTIFNAANEEAVAAFLAGKICYLEIPDSIEAAMREVGGFDGPSWTYAAKKGIALETGKRKTLLSNKKTCNAWPDLPSVEDILCAEKAARTYVKEILALA